MVRAADARAVRSVGTVQRSHRDEDQRARGRSAAEGELASTGGTTLGVGADELTSALSPKAIAAGFCADPARLESASPEHGRVVAVQVRAREPPLLD